jgi:hypothetical protein
MDVTSPETATLGIWTIARFAALAVLATEALFLYTRPREEAGHDARLRSGDHVPGTRVFWALTPAVLLAGLCLWCTIFVVR